jgi:histidinol-phosphatase (PHP family)
MVCRLVSVLIGEKYFMKYYDQHIHSAISDDCETPMAEMALAAADLGLSGVTFTDHCDIEHYETGKIDPDCYDGPARRTVFEDARERAEGRTEVLFGIEIGSANHHPDVAARIAADGFDLVIASVHNLAGLPDFYSLGRDGRLEDEAEDVRLLERYAIEHLELVAQGGFDVIGHIGYPLRYMENSCPGLSLEPFRDIFAEALRLMTEKGIALEFNTSCFRQGMVCTPEPWLLRLYKDLGGELVTLGSDSHEPTLIGAGFDEGADMLRSVGFSRITRFINRKPEFVGL